MKQEVEQQNDEKRLSCVLNTMTNRRSAFGVVGVVVLFSLATVIDGLKQGVSDENGSKVGDNRKWTGKWLVFQ